MACTRCGFDPCECLGTRVSTNPDDFVYLVRGGTQTRFDRCTWRYHLNRCGHAATSHMGKGPRCQYHEFLGRRLDGNAELVAEQALFDEWWQIRYQQDTAGKKRFWHTAHGGAKLVAIT